MVPTTTDNVTNVPMVELLRNVRNGDIVSGKIVEIDDKFALLDISCKTEGLLPLTELDKQCTLGSVIDVLIEKTDSDTNMIIVSRKKAEKVKALNDLYIAHRNNLPITGKIIEDNSNEDGFKVLLSAGIVADLPYHLVDRNKMRNKSRYLNQS